MDPSAAPPPCFAALEKPKKKKEESVEVVPEVGNKQDLSFSALFGAAKVMGKAAMNEFDGTPAKPNPMLAKQKSKLGGGGGGGGLAAKLKKKKEAAAKANNGAKDGGGDGGAQPIDAAALMAEEEKKAKGVSAEEKSKILNQSLEYF